MRIDPIQLNNQNKLINDYRNNKSAIMEYFDYAPFGDYGKRVNDLKSRTFNRKQLTDVLHTINRHWDAPEATYHNIERLNNEESVVVIGGQQAGLMTGPLYTINKIISIIQLAKQQEAALNIPVVPVFWIAGEDHDFDEINHVFLPEKSRMKKHTIAQRITDKQSVSNIAIDEKLANDWIDRCFEELQETVYTKDLYISVKDCLKKSNSYVDFFARVLYQFFNEEGLVLIDSGYPQVRQLESDHFKELIKQQPEITAGVYEAYQQVKQDGYSLSLEADPREAHLFYHMDGERILLTRNETEKWAGKQDEVELTTEELLSIAEKTPELLSNNVVTRPLMQELLFPTLAFIGGNGEIGYWSVLKPAFAALDIKMPPVVPRLSFTYLGRNMDKIIRKYDISDARAVEEGVEDFKENWLASKDTPPIEQMANTIKAEIDQVHKPLRDAAQDMRADLAELADKNLFYLKANIDYLKNRMEKVLEEKYAKELAEFDMIHNTLHPLGGLQERVWNPLPLVNEYGTDFIKQLINEPCSFEKEHFVVYI
ncbi:MAG TPA: bacillithiol biosynthesis cysteine-adding enzyme BshC [Virgibacillus sp.]|nr:bacillithiol biosynthesis cysteine-adding enzyme BshC [Virgibacillus sp.]